jgi:hypothetical protein
MAKKRSYETPRHLAQYRTWIRSQIWRNPTRSNSVPVVLVPGDQAPILTGESGGYYTIGGTPIRHPSAYAKRGWSNMQYCTSTESVDVGADWAAAHRIPMSVFGG